MIYGKELILDLHNCDVTTFNRSSIRKYLKELCALLNMEQCERYWWDDYRVPPDMQETEPHLKGTSVVQIIKTSNIVIHTLNLLGNVYINIFSCKGFNTEAAKVLSGQWFKGTVANSQVVDRL